MKVTTYEDLLESDVPQRAVSKPKTESIADLFARARKAGIDAGNANTPTPMIVGSPSTPLGTDIDTTKPMYYVSGGVCGFAWVSVKARVNSAIGKWLIASGNGQKSEYHRAILISVHDHDQSMSRKEAHARAIAKVLRDAGWEAYAESRID